MNPYYIIGDIPWFYNCILLNIDRELIQRVKFFIEIQLYVFITTLFGIIIHNLWNYIKEMA